MDEICVVLDSPNSSHLWRISWFSFGFSAEHTAVAGHTYTYCITTGKVLTQLERAARAWCHCLQNSIVHKCGCSQLSLQISFLVWTALISCLIYGLIDQFQVKNINAFDLRNRKWCRPICLSDSIIKWSLQTHMETYSNVRCKLMYLL